MASYSDNFNRADSSYVGADWTSDGNWSISDNRLRAAGVNYLKYNHPLETLAQYSQITFVDAADYNVFGFVAPVLRGSDDGNSGYYWRFRQHGSSSRLFKRQNGADTQLLETGSGGPPTGQVLRFEISSDHILRTYINGELDGEYDDSVSPLVGYYTGFRGHPSGDAIAYGDDFFAGDLESGTTEAFQLRHNPRTNKVIPVLSSPTVTDIGANCVRPRVMKGY